MTNKFISTLYDVIYPFKLELAPYILNMSTKNSVVLNSVPGDSFWFFSEDKLYDKIDVLEHALGDHIMADDFECPTYFQGLTIPYRPYGKTVFGLVNRGGLNHNIFLYKPFSDYFPTKNGGFLKTK